jgi:bla regulator protein BlaR1
MLIDISKHILTASFWGSIVIFAILVLQKILGTKIGAKSQSYLWLVAVLRLVFFAPPEIPIAFKSALKIKEFNNIIPKNNLSYKASEILSWFDTSNFNEIQVESNYFHIDWLNIVCILYLAFVVLLSLKRLFLKCKLQKHFKANSIVASCELKNLLDKNCQKMKVYRSVQLLFSNSVESPIVFGFFNPTIVLPINSLDFLSYREIEYAMLHELAHIKRFDVLIFEITAFLKKLYVFNPFIRYGLARYEQCIETACDAMALELVSSNEKKAYGLCLIKWLESVNLEKLEPSVLHYASTKKQLQRRLFTIMNFKNNANKILAMGCILSLSGFLVLAEVQAQSICDNKDLYESSPKVLSMESAIPQDTQSAKIQATETKSEEVTETTPAENIEWLWPLDNKYKRISSSYGNKMHPVLKKETFHSGIDIPAPRGNDIKSTRSGKVIFSGEIGGYGRTIIIDHGDGYATFYAHTSELLVNRDDAISAGTIIAKVGSTGRSTGSHLHFEIRKDGKTLDPLTLVSVPEE